MGLRASPIFRQMQFNASLIYDSAANFISSCRKVKVFRFYSRFEHPTKKHEARRFTPIFFT